MCAPHHDHSSAQLVRARFFHTQAHAYACYVILKASRPFLFTHTAHTYAHTHDDTA